MSPLAATKATTIPPAPPTSGPIISHSFPQLYAEHFAFVWRSVKRLGVPSGSQDDAVQDVFMVVHRNLHTFEGRSSVKSWLFGIVRRVAHDYRRTADRKDPSLRASGPPADPSLVADHNLSPHESVERADALRAAHAMLQQLEPDKREVLMLAELEQMTIPEIADAIGVNVNTVYSRLRAARLDFNRIVTRCQAAEQWRDR